MAFSNDGLIPLIVKRLKDTVLRGVPSLGQRNKPRVYDQVYTRRRIVVEQLFLICGSRNGGIYRGSVCWVYLAKLLYAKNCIASVAGE